MKMPHRDALEHKFMDRAQKLFSEIAVDSTEAILRSFAKEYRKPDAERITDPLSAINKETIIFLANLGTVAVKTFNASFEAIVNQLVPDMPDDMKKMMLRVSEENMQNYFAMLKMIEKDVKVTAHCVPFNNKEEDANV